MKKSLTYIAVLALVAVAFTACDDDFQRPPVVMPQATLKANTTIQELKTQFYTSNFNYATKVGIRPDGTNYVIKGRVTTSDAAGNFFKQVVIQDETSAIQLSIDAYDLNQTYQQGQEVYVNVTGMYIGAYGKLMQLGGAPTSEYPSRLNSTLATEQIEVSGLADLGKLDTTTVTMAQLATIAQNQEEWLQWQCRLVKIDNVTFADAGKKTLADENANTSRTISDGTGSMILYTSGYSDFYDYYCPTGQGQATGILSYYNSSWQLRLIDIEGLQGYELEKKPSSGGDTPGTTTGNGSEDTPFNVADIQGGATGTGVWVQGYVVGWVEGQYYTEGAHFDANATVASNILLADAPDVTDAAKCIPVQLPVGDVRNAISLMNNKSVYKKQVMLKGNTAAYFGQSGLKEVSAFKGEGLGGDTPDTPADPVTFLNQNFDASTSIPAGWSQIQVAGNKSWYVATFQENNYAAMTGYKGTAPFDQWLLSPAVDMSKVDGKTLTFRTQVNGYSSTTTAFEVYVLTSNDLATAQKTQLKPSLPTAPASGYSDWVQSGTLDLKDFTGVVYIAFRYAATQDANYATWCVDNVVLGTEPK